MTQKPNHRRPKSRKSSKPSPRIHPTVWVAIVGLIGTVIVAFMNFPPFENWLDAKLNPTPTITATPKIAETQTLAATENRTSTPEILPSPTFTQTPEPIPPSPTFENVTTANETMSVQLTSSSSEGRAPFLVNFNAKNSYVSRTDGTTLTCIERNVCNYTWSVRFDGKTIYGPTLGDSVFSYTFQKKGQYVVIAYVCRGKACSYSAVNIVAR